MRRCGVLRSYVRSLRGWRALAVVHWKGGGIPVDLLDTAVSADCVDTPLRVLVVLLNMAASALSLLDV